MSEAGGEAGNPSDLPIKRSSASVESTVSREKEEKEWQQLAILLVICPSSASLPLVSFASRAYTPALSSLRSRLATAFTAAAAVKTELFALVLLSFHVPVILMPGSADLLSASTVPLVHKSSLRVARTLSYLSPDFAG